MKIFPKFTETLTESMVSQWNWSRMFSQDSYVAVQRRSQKFSVQLFISMFNDIFIGTKDNEKACLAHAKVVKVVARKFGSGQWSFIGPCPKRSGILWKRTVHKEFGTVSRNRCCWNSSKADVRFSVPRPHCPRSTKKQTRWKTVDSFCCHSGNNWDSF